MNNIVNNLNVQPYAGNRSILAFKIKNNLKYFKII